MSDNEYERFEISDYDLQNEFNPNRPRRRPTKNQQIYGIWADSESDSENESRRGRRGSRKEPKKQKDYTAPVNFVAGGIQQSGKKTKDAKEKADEEEEEENEDVSNITDEEDNVRPAFGRKPAQVMDADSPAGSTDDDSSDNNDGKKAMYSQRSGFGSKPHHQTKSHGHVGAWEQHTRGIGAKLLAKMGYEPGKGLGKDLQGISQPVEAHVRKGRGAIGAYGPETAASVPGKAQQVIREDEDVREAKEFKEQLNKWKKTGDKSKRYYYKSVEEVIEKSKSSNFVISENLSKKLGNVPVIDMTGPEKRVLSGYHALTSAKVLDEDLYDLPKPASRSAKKATSTTTAAFTLPELMHNLNLIVNVCEQEIISIDKTEHDAVDQQKALEDQRKNLENIAQLEKNHIETLTQALTLIEELTDGGSTGEAQLSLERAETIFLELQQNFAAEYKEFALGDLAAGVIAPLVKAKLDNWQPLEQPTAPIETIKRWRTILETNPSLQSETRNVFDPYSSLVWAGVVPSFRACAASWNPKDHQSMAALLDSWAPLFPAWILDSVLEQLVLPQLSSGVREWDPLTDTVPIHVWILPWNHILGHKMEEYIFPTIRVKLGAALQAWMPQDRSARAMLTPWKGAFHDADMQMFLIQHIIPKLQIVLNEFTVNPLQQDLELWNQVWEWNEVVPTMLMAQLLDKYFFPKWMQVLVLWLNQAPDYAEISRWFSGWKNILSEAILCEPTIQEHFRRALELMHRATSEPNPNISTGLGSGIPCTPAPPPPQPPPAPPMFIDIQMAPQIDFRELVSQKCAERGIIFAPLPGRRELGKQIYRVGKIYCIIDRNVCMVSDNSLSNWTPMPLPQMLDSASTGVF